MSFSPWGLLSVVVLAAAVLGTRVAVRRMVRETQPDHREEGRRVRDMTPAAKVVATITAIALVGVLAARVVDPTPGWIWWCLGVTIAGSAFVGVSEHRRVRRDPRLPEYRGERGDAS